jgi:putative ABC transport system permease protein
MILLFIRLALRRLLAQSFYSIINVSCLSMGLLTFILTFLYVRHEYSFDDFHSKRERIFRLTASRDGKVGAMVPYVWGYYLQAQWKEVESLATIQNITIALPVKVGETLYAQHGIVGADSTFFNIFDFPVVKGNKQEFLRSPGKIVVTPQTATKFFGDDDPIGKSLEINLWGQPVLYEVEGVVDSPDNSHMPFQLIIPMHFVRQHFFSQDAFASWSTRFAYTYILMADADRYQHHHTGIKSYLRDFLLRNGGQEIAERFTPDIQPLGDIYLTDDLAFDFTPRGSKQNLRILFVAGLSILLMSIINYINIISAQQLTRLKEIGVKRIMGSTTPNLILHSIVESVLLAFISLGAVYLVMMLVLSGFNALTGKSFTARDLWEIKTVATLAGIATVTGVIAGLFPAIMISGKYLSSILTAKVTGTATSRKLLMTAQFVVAILLLVGTGVVHRQVRFMEEKDRGFETDQVIVLQDAREVASDAARLDQLRNELLTLRQVNHVSGSSSSPGQITWAAGYEPEGFEEGDRVSLSTIYADDNFVDTYGLTITTGRDFDRMIGSDSTGFLINEAAVKFFAAKDTTWMTETLNRELKTAHGEGKVIGVVRDFHLGPYTHEVQPLVFQWVPENFFNIQIGVSTVDMAETLAMIEAKWKKLFPDIPFTYTFLNEEFAKILASDKKLRQILTICTGIAISLAMLSLFGLASFQSFEKARETSIRKVMGATEFEVSRWLLWRFLKRILVANAIAIPLSYYMASLWLSTFAYRCSFPLFIFPVTLAITVVAATLAVWHHVRRSATINLVESLKGG